MLAEALLERSLGQPKGKVLGTSVVTELKWYDSKDYNPPWIKALAEGRQRIRNST